MGLQDVFFQLRLPFDSAEARELSTRIAEEIYFHALWASAELAEAARAAPGVRRDARRARASCSSTCGASTPTQTRRAGTRCGRGSREHGLRNSLLIAIAPTATIASIAGCYECIEPQVSNLFKRETLSGDFLQINRYLVARAQGAGPVDRGRSATRIKLAEGSVQGIAELPDELAALYRTAWEIPMRSLIDMAADRGAVHRPEPVAQPVHREPDHRQALVDVHVRLEERA